MKGSRVRSLVGFLWEVPGKRSGPNCLFVRPRYFWFSVHACVYIPELKLAQVAPGSQRGDNSLKTGNLGLVCVWHRWPLGRGTSTEPVFFPYFAPWKKDGASWKTTRVFPSGKMGFFCPCFTTTVLFFALFTEVTLAWAGNKCSLISRAIPRMLFVDT